MPNQKEADKNRYFNILIEEEMLNLGQSIYDFRHLKEALADNIDEEVLSLVDNIYQSQFDKIMDALANCNDLHVADSAIQAIDKSINIRRGFIKL